MVALQGLPAMGNLLLSNVSGSDASHQLLSKCAVQGNLLATPTFLPGWHAWDFVMSMCALEVIIRLHMVNTL